MPGDREERSGPPASRRQEDLLVALALSVAAINTDHLTHLDHVVTGLCHQPHDTAWSLQSEHPCQVVYVLSVSQMIQSLQQDRYPMVLLSDGLYLVFFANNMVLATT